MSYSGHGFALTLLSQVVNILRLALNESQAQDLKNVAFAWLKSLAKMIVFEMQKNLQARGKIMSAELEKKNSPCF